MWMWYYKEDIKIKSHDNMKCFNAMWINSLPLHWNLCINKCGYKMWTKNKKAKSYTIKKKISVGKDNKYRKLI